MPAAKDDLHLLVDMLPDDAVPVVEALLTFLVGQDKELDRAAENAPTISDRVTNRARGKAWVDTERRGMARRRRTRSAPVSDPDPGGSA